MNMRRRPGTRVGEVWLVVVFLVASVALIWPATADFTRRYGGVLYPLDDSYIHLALARTLAEHGVWGLLPSRPSAASSSPLWTMLLAAVAKLTPGMSRTAFSWVPLIGNLAAGTALIVFWSRRFEMTRWPMLAPLVLIAIVPLPAIAFIGMEHVLHILVGTLLAWMGATLLELEDRPSVRQLVGIGLLSALAVATRYESMALVAGLSMLALWRRQWWLAAAVVTPAVVVVLGFGAIWVANGGWWVPNSFLLKTEIGDTATSASLASRMIKHIVEVSQNSIGRMTIGLAIVLAALSAWIRRHHGPERSLLLLALASTVAQVLFGKLGWLFRYEAWLIALDVMAILLAVRVAAAGRRWVFEIALLGLFLACAPRAVHAIHRTVAAAHDREWEHFGPTEALADFRGEPLLVNDVGVISYYGTGRPLDIYGLADNETLRLKREGRLGPAGLRAFGERENARIGEFQFCWPALRGQLPEGWLLVEAWTGPRNIIFGDLTVAFMAADAQSAARLHASLSRASIPHGVHRFDGTSQLVQAYNASHDKLRATGELCNSASLIATGLPDPQGGDYGTLTMTLGKTVSPHN